MIYNHEGLWFIHQSTKMIPDWAKGGRIVNTHSERERGRNVELKRERGRGERGGRGGIPGGTRSACLQYAGTVPPYPDQPGWWGLQVSFGVGAFGPLAAAAAPSVRNFFNKAPAAGSAPPQHPEQSAASADNHAMPGESHREGEAARLGGVNLDCGGAGQMPDPAFVQRGVLPLGGGAGGVVCTTTSAQCAMTGNGSPLTHEPHASPEALHARGAGAPMRKHDSLSSHIAAGRGAGVISGGAAAGKGRHTHLEQQSGRVQGTQGVLAPQGRIHKVSGAAGGKGKQLTIRGMFRRV